MKITAFADPRDAVATLVARRAHEGESLAGVSRLLGRHPRYLDRFVREGVPKRLADEDQRLLQRYLGGDPRDFGAPNIPTEAERDRWQARRKTMRQIDRDELTWLLVYGLQRLPASVRAMMADRRPDQARKGQHLAAQHLAAQLGRLEMLSDAPPPPPFRFADIEGGSGVPAVEG